MNRQTRQFLYLLLTLITVVAGYAYLRYAYRITDTMPFTQEIVLIILGTLATVFITALLLNQQTAVEIQKEQNIKFLDLKAKTYEKLLDLMEDMSSVNNFGPAEITRLRFITHRLAIFSSPEVLDEYNRFLAVVSDLSRDGSFINDTQLLSEALGKLTIPIRADLLNENRTQRTYTTLQIRRMITSNSDRSSNIDIRQ